MGMKIKPLKTSALVNQLVHFVVSCIERLMNLMYESVSLRNFN
jgi:hypothetical protein